LIWRRRGDRVGWTILRGTWRRHASMAGWETEALSDAQAQLLCSALARSQIRVLTVGVGSVDHGTVACVAELVRGCRWLECLALVLAPPPEEKGEDPQAQMLRAFGLPGTPADAEAAVDVALLQRHHAIFSSLAPAIGGVAALRELFLGVIPPYYVDQSLQWPPFDGSPWFRCIRGLPRLASLALMLHPISTSLLLHQIGSFKDDNTGLGTLKCLSLRCGLLGSAADKAKDLSMGQDTVLALGALKPLQEALNQLPVLETLDLADTGLQDHHLSTILVPVADQQLPMIRVVDISLNLEISRSAVQKLEKALSEASWGKGPRVRHTARRPGCCVA